MMDKPMEPNKLTDERIPYRFCGGIMESFDTDGMVPFGDSGSFVKYNGPVLQPSSGETLPTPEN